MRAVLDVNVLVSATLSRHGAPARCLLAWQAGAFELIVSPLLLAELERTLAYPKLRRHIPPEEARAFVDLLRRTAVLVEDPPGPPPVRASDPADDYLVALAVAANARLVSGDRHLLDLGSQLPIEPPAAFIDRIRDLP